MIEGLVSGSRSRFVVEVKHDTEHKKWVRLSVSALTPKLEADAYAAQYASDHQMNPHQIAWRILEIDRSEVGQSTGRFIRLVVQKESAATANRPVSV